MGPVLAASTAIGLANTGLKALDSALDGLKNARTPSEKKAKELSEDFESVFLSTMFGQVFNNMQGEGPMGADGHNEAWRSMLVDEYTKTISQSGGIGISSTVYREILAMQEAKS